MGRKPKTVTKAKETVKQVNLNACKCGSEYFVDVITKQRKQTKKIMCLNCGRMYEA